MSSTALKPAYFVEVLEDGRWAFFVDSSMLSCYSRCPRLFYYQYICMQRRKGMPGAMSIGSWWSRVMELFYLNMQSRQKQNAGYVTREEMMTFAASAWRQCQNCKHEHQGGALCDTPCMANGQVQKYCDCNALRNMEAMATQNPKAYKDFGGAKGAIVMASGYYDRIGGLDNSNLKIVASEAGFGLKGELTLYEDNEIVIHYVGKPDLVVYDSSSSFLAPLDHKTVARIDSGIQKKYKPHGQTTGYIWAVGQLAASLGFYVPVDRCILNIAARLIPAEKPRDGVKKPRFTRVLPNYNPEEVEEWKVSTVQKVKDLKRSLLNDEWQMRDNSCHLYGGCDFRVVDAVPLVNRRTVLQSDFVTVEPWVPYAVEEDEDADL